MSANIKDTLKKKVNQAQNKAIFNKYGTPDVVATIKGKKVEYGNQTDNKKTQNNNRPKNSAIQTLSSTKKAQVTQQQKAKSKLGTDKKGYTVTDSNEVMQNYAKKTGSYDVNKYKKDTFDKQRAQEEKAKKIIKNIKKGDTLNTVTKKAGQAAKNTGKFLTDFDYRNKVGEKALMGAGTALSQFSKGALKTVENWGDAARSKTDDFNNWVAYKTGIIDKKEYEKQKKISEDSIKADAVGDFWRNNLGWNEENAQALKDYSYVTEDNLLGQLSYGLGQQAPALMIGNTQAVQNLMSNPALQSVAGDSTVKNIARGLIRNAPMNAEIGLRSYGGAVEEALQNGATMEQARRYGLLNAGTEIATEWMTGGIPGVENTTGLFDKGVDAVIDKATGKLTKETSKAIAKSLLSYGFDALGEGLEESVSEIFSPLIKNMTYSNGEKIDWNSVLNAGIMGMLQGGILNAPSAVTNARSDISQARQIDRANQEAARQQAEQQAREELNTAAQSRLNEVYQQNQENTPIFNQQNRMMELAQQQVQAIQQQVQSGQISPQEGMQQIQNIQRYITAQQNAQTSQTTNETQQSNVIGQEQQNVVQNANNEAVQNQQQNGNLVEDYMNDNYENMVGDYIDQNYGQQQESNLVEDYMNNGEDNLVNDYMNNYEDGNMVENFMNAQNELQQTQQDSVKKQTNAFNLGQNETKLPTNTDDKIQNFRNSVKNENVKDADGFYKAVEKIISDKDYNVILDSSIKNKQGRAVNALITNENGITIKINPNSNRAAEILLMHEVTHGIETKEMSKLIMDYASKNSEFNEALESLKKAYGTNDVTSEVVADISGQLFGNQEFINNLSTEKPGVFKRIYNKIVELANKFTGNSKQALFIRDLKNKWEKAYREANIESSQIKLKDQVKYSQNGEITDNKGRELNINMQNYMEDSQATDDKGQLVTLYHTTTDMIKQFNVFDPANKYDGNYKFGKYNVTYLTDNQEMSGSYSQYDYRKANTKRLNSIEEANEYLDYNSSLRIVDIENTNQAIKNHFEGNPNRYFLVSGDLTTFGEYKTEQELLRDVIPTSQWVMRGNSNFQYEVYANITKPFIIDAEGRNWDNISREIVQEYKDVVDNLSQEQKQELSKFANDSLIKYQDWLMSDKYSEYLKYNDEYKKLNKTTSENLVLLSMKENVTPQDYIDMYNEFGKEGKAPDSKITVDGEEMTFAEYAARWCKLEMENADYSFACSYFWTQAGKQYRNQLQQVGVEKMFDMAKYEFRDWAVEDTLSRTLKTNDIVNKVIEMNENGDDYDGVIIMNTTDYGPGYVEERDPHDVYVVFNSNQIKSVDNPDPTNDPDIRYSEKAKQWQDFLEKNYKNTGTTTKLNEKIGTETKQTEVPQTQKQQRETKAAEAKQERVTKTEPVVKLDTETKKQTAKQITDVLNKNIKNSENADIFDAIEKDTGKKLRGFVKTATNATGDVDLVSKMDKVKITYDQLSNKEIMKQAENYFKDMKYQDGVEDVLDFIKSDKRVTALDMAKIDYMVLQAKARNDMRTYQNLVEEAGIITTQSGQVSQAVSLIQQSDPMFQLSVLNRIIQIEQENGTKQFKGVKIKEKLVQEVMDSYDENGDFNKEKFDKAMDKLKQDIANQMKVTPMEKADAWRYLSMLGNPKTHIRNVVANFAMKILQGTKNKIAAGGEALVDVGSKAISGKGIQRTKTLMPSTRDVKSFSVQTMEDYFNKSKPESKYNDKITNQKGLKGELLQRRNKFNNKNPFGFLLNLADKGNSALLNLEDNVFNKSAAKSAMANYLTANGIRTQADIDAHPDIVQAAFDYGILQGNEATFHQKSTTADTIRQSREKLRKGSGLSKAVGYGIDATMPFVSTPINIAKTGVEHTPGLGLLKTITDVQQAPSNMKAAVFIDSLSKQLSGGLLAYAGYLLAKNGWLVGGGDDDSEKKLEKNLGAMNYAIKVGNDYYDISFLSPSAMPLLMGANLNEALKGKGVKENVIADVLYQSLDPLTEMSFMSSVQNVLKSYNSGAKGLSDMGSSALTGYISQYIPTLMSQFASSRDEYKRSTGGNTFLEKTKQQLMYKVPGLREKLPEQVNVWGEAKENKQRGLEAFLNPMNRSTAKVDDTTKEIEKIYEETGTGMPNMGIKKEQLGNTLNQKEYTQFKKTYGKTAKKELDDLIKSSKYKNASTEEKAAMITRIYSYSTHKSKEEYSNKSGVEYEPQTKYYAMIDAFDIPFNKYVQMGLEDIKADKGSNGKSISGSKKTKVIKAIEESGLTKVQKQAIIKQKGYKTSKNDDYELKREIYSSNLSNEEKNKILEYLKLK